jgi:membrane protease YdiL (CAAX protease family)
LVTNVRHLIIDSEGRPQLWWRLLAYTLAFVICVVGTSLVGHVLRSMVARWLLSFAVTAVGVGSLFASFHFLRTRMDRRPWSWFGLSASRDGRVALANGFVAGVLMLGGMFCAEWGLGWIEPSWAFPSVSILAVVASMASSFGIGFSEELLNRGAFIQNLGERFPLWVATAFTGVTFGLMHLSNPAQHVDVSFVLACALGTLFLVLARFVTGSLWWAVGWHSSWDWMQDLLGLAEPGAAKDYSVVSLAQHGPAVWVGHAPSLEGGLLAIAIVGLGVAVFWTIGRRRGLVVGWMRPLFFGEAASRGLGRAYASSARSPT